VVFAAAYEARLVDELPRGVVPHSFQREDRETGSHVLLSVTPATGHRWVGSVQMPRSALRGALTLVATTPNPGRVCVIAAGDAYLIASDMPGEYDSLDTGGPVVSIRSLVSDGLLLLSSPWVVTAIGDQGRVWQTTRLAIEGLRLGEARSGRLEGLADPTGPEPRAFSVDLRTGQHIGGAAAL